MEEFKKWLPFAAEQLLPEERDEVLLSIENGQMRFSSVPEHFWDDKDFVLEAVRIKCYALGFASAKLRSDPEVVKVALRKTGSTLQYATNALRTDPELVSMAMETYPRAISFADKSVKDNETFALAVVTRNGAVLRHLPYDMQKNYDVVLAAVRNDPIGGFKGKYAFQSAVQDLKNNREIAWEASTRNPGAAAFVDKRLLSAHDDILLRAVHVEPPLLRWASTELQKNIRAMATKYESLGRVRTYLDETRMIRAAFMEFLCCVCAKSVQGKAASSKINLDEDTSLDLKKHIAGYAGFPFGDDLGHFRTVEHVAPILEAYFQNETNDSLVPLNADRFFHQQQRPIRIEVRNEQNGVAVARAIQIQVRQVQNEAAVPRPIQVRQVQNGVAVPRPIQIQVVRHEQNEVRAVQMLRLDD